MAYDYVRSGNNSSSGSSGRRTPSNGVDYPLRFFNMLCFDRPKTMAEIFKWCITLDESHGLLNRITDTMARYPITAVVVTNDIGEHKRYWSDLLNKKLNIQEDLVANGKDLYSFGNCVVTIVPPFKRYLKCGNKDCGKYNLNCINDSKASERKFDWKYENFVFIGKCMHCGKRGTMTIQDEYLTGDDFAAKVKIQRWPIQNIKIIDLGIAGKKKIYYRIERKYIKLILKGDKFAVANLPDTFLLACKENGQTPLIELPEDMTFHYKHESITEPESEGMAKPFFFSAWKDVFMSFVLRKAQEMIAADHLLPNRFIFPQASPGSVDPLSRIDGGNWMSIVQGQLKRQQNDPNEIGVVPFPLGYQALGGQGKAMSLREEIELQDRRVLTQLGIPPELIYGGMTWSGSNISLRMLENMFLYYINKQNTFLEFFVNYVASMSDKTAPTGVRLKQFKMADDVQQIQMRSNLGLQNRISETTALSPMDIDLEAEAQQAEDEAPLIQRIAKARQMNIAKAGLDVSKETNLAQVDIQANTQLHQNDVQGTMSLTDGFIATTARGYVNKLNAMPPDQRAAELRSLQAQDPAKFNEVVGALYGAAEQAPVAPLPEQRAPRSGAGSAQV